MDCSDADASVSVGGSHDSLSDGGSHGSAHRLFDETLSDEDGGSHGSAHRLPDDEDGGSHGSAHRLRFETKVDIFGEKVGVKGTNAGASADKIGVGGGFFVGVACELWAETGTEAARCLRLCRYSMWMWLKRLAAAFCCSGVLLSSSEREEKEVVGEEGEKSAINLCASLDLGSLLSVIGGVFWGDVACASQSFAGTGPNFSA